MACPLALGQVGSVVSMDVAVVLCSLRLTRNLFRYHVDNGGNGHMEKIEQEDTSETHFFLLQNCRFTRHLNGAEKQETIYFLSLTLR